MGVQWHIMWTLFTFKRSFHYIRIIIWYTILTRYYCSDELEKPMHIVGTTTTWSTRILLTTRCILNLYDIFAWILAAFVFSLLLLLLLNGRHCVVNSRASCWFRRNTRAHTYANSRRRTATRNSWRLRRIYCARPALYRE